MKIFNPTTSSSTITSAAGQRQPMAVAERHYVNGNPLKGPWPEGMSTIVLGKG